MTENDSKLNDSKIEILVLVPEIEKQCRTLLFHLRMMRSIHRHIAQRACEKLEHAVISCRLDYANLLLIVLPKKE